MSQFLDILHSEHEKVKDLFKQVQAAGSSSRKEKLFNELKHDLQPHMRGEEKYFYPALQKKPEHKEDVLEALEEHHAAKLVLNEVDEMTADEERWDAKIAVLKEMVEHHIEEEEKKIFPEARESLSESKLREIGELFENEKSPGMRRENAGKRE